MSGLGTKENKGMIFSVERCSLHDGPGIRTSVFFKGCTLSCIWCHNPEGLKKTAQLRYLAEKCTGCQNCAAVCPAGVHSFEESGLKKQNGHEDGNGGEMSGPEGSCGFCRVHKVEYSRCMACGRCVNACAAGALMLSGAEMSAVELFDTVKKDLPFYRRTGGGVTISGGEPLMQPEFAAELLTLCKNAGIHTAVETAGHVPWEAFETVIPVTDLFLYDYKASSEEAQHRLTGGSRQLIMDNLEKLNRAMADKECAVKNCGIWLRCPVIPGLNDSEEHFEEINRLKGRLDMIRRTEIMPYHELGKGKWEQLGMEYELKDLKAPKEETTEEWRRRLG